MTSSWIWVYLFRHRSTHYSSSFVRTGWDLGTITLAISQHILNLMEISIWSYPNFKSVRCTVMAWVDLAIWCDRIAVRILHRICMVKKYFSQILIKPKSCVTSVEVTSVEGECCDVFGLGPVDIVGSDAPKVDLNVDMSNAQPSIVIVLQ